MGRVAVIVDSIACVTRELVQQYDITVIPLNFYFEDKLYRDWVDITPSEAYELFLKNPDAFKTSAVSPGVFLETFRELAGKTESILCITVSSKISTVYNSALDAKDMLLEEFPELNIEVMDSFTCTAAEGFIALEAAKAANEGKNLKGVLEVAEDIRKKVDFIVYLDTIRHVYRSGRIPKIASQAGTILNVRPLLAMASGVLHMVGVVRSRKKGIERLLRVMERKVGSNPAHVAVMHAYAPDEAEELREKVASNFNCSELWITEFSPIMGYSCGTGTLGLAFYSDN